MSLSEAFADDRAVTTGRLPCPPGLADRADTDAIDVFGDAARLTAFANPPAVSVSAPVVADPTSATCTAIQPSCARCMARSARWPARWQPC